jgi:hypothetical protein
MELKPVAEALADVIVVVSGLPRSGTSLMMGMLQAGGVPLMNDGQRQADQDNPSGYFELEAVKRLNANADWLAGAMAKAVKIVVPLVFHLPARFKYRIIFMERDLDEVIASQTAMLQRMGRQPMLAAEELKRAFERQLTRAREILTPNADRNIIFCQHRELLKHPRDIAVSIASFLGADLQIDAMVERVDPDLYRQRRG